VNHGPLVKIQAATAAEVCANFDLDVEAKPLLRDGMKPHEFLAALTEQKKFVEAIDFMAHALPVREGIWWGCLCMQHAVGDRLSPPERAAATAVVRWVMQPTEETRTAAKAPAEAADPLSPAGALAMAAYQAGGGAPGAIASAKSIARAIKLASIKAERIAKMQECYLELGMEIAEGRLI
jgi:hypothetical protein